MLGTPDFAGPLTTDQPLIPMTDELALARESATEFPVLAAFDTGGGAELRLVDATSPMIVAGNGDGIVDIAAAGLLDPDRPVLYAATIDDGPGGAAGGGDTDPWWVITDTNRKQGRRWSTIGFNLGALESTGALQTDADPNDNDLDIFEGSDLDDQTVAVHLGDVGDVRASSYGSDILYTAEDAPNFAVDGDPTTAWRAGIAEGTAGLSLSVDLRTPESISGLVLLQPQVGANNRFITRVRITVGGASFEVDLDASSRVVPGQSIDLAEVGVDGSVTSLDVEVVADNVGAIASFAGQPGVGFAEVGLVRVDESVVVDDRVVRLPIAATLGIADDDRLTYVFTRQRIDSATPNRQAPEPQLNRQFDVPVGRSFEVSGDARVSATASDEVLNDLIEPGDVSAVASARLPGSVASRGAAAVDGDPATAWQTPFDASIGAVLAVSTNQPVAADRDHVDVAR